jgi:hypothetical protein
MPEWSIGTQVRAWVSPAGLYPSSREFKSHCPLGEGGFGLPLPQISC